MIRREAEKEIIALAKQFKAVAVVGPRQSGKTTLVRWIFKDKEYVSFENPDIRLFAIEDPRGFLSNYPNGAIFDEAQRVPDIFSYLQQILDESVVKGLFIITGSNNFLLQESISQSLAGRVGYLNLLPLTLHEIGDKERTISQTIFKGCYPSLYNDTVDTTQWYSNYIRTYIERDVRLIKNITNLVVFEKFLRLCAGRIGQLLNMNSLAVEIGVDTKTISSWISVLEASFVVFRLQPYHSNFNKRVVKMPKLYFYDTGLASALLGIQNSEQIDVHPFRGALFENLIIVDFLKSRFNKAKTNNLYFWRDNLGKEIDLIIDNGMDIIPIEIKSGQTITIDYFKGVVYWNKLAQKEGGYVIYGGDLVQKRSNSITAIPFSAINSIENKLL
ncbi:ATP-binding protein [Flavobacterium sp. GSP27]|uniref:ATP-binding protein n=1 Tax=Flavobacterium bomense TaxID=2497483 RepID=A0A432CNE3_9FLAO|nr:MULTISPECIES: ATP-binding protein [Flavobacterium]RTY94175.1 ATP-binding protein [Flavobacterium sp. GSN2]RTY66247.1 ATP-binding protein [Flavobacterium sp. LB2P53]RTY83478.1 ATP-binding protein [Flavobacterium sp. LS1P28]RTY83732.1 ATP-binding protein [Flavobacterium sp. ZB4P23]RTY91085.1 ATP-binding protein [Flavobacterium sp. RSP46]